MEEMVAAILLTVFYTTAIWAGGPWRSGRRPNRRLRRLRLESLAAWRMTVTYLGPDGLRKI
jgi:hypothetical protein